MIEINEAFAILSDKKRKADYDLERTGAKIPTPVTKPSVVDWEPPPIKKTATTVARHQALDQTVAQDFLQKLKIQIVQQGASLKLKEETEKPWTWILHGGSWSANYWVALRICSLLNPNVMRGIVSEVQTLVSQRRSGWKNNFFVFLLAFQSLAEGETVLKLCRTYCNQEENSTHKNLVNIGALDLNHRRSVLCGKKTTDKNLAQVLAALAVS